jgi:hypothetical protein
MGIVHWSLMLSYLPFAFKVSTLRGGESRVEVNVGLTSTGIQWNGTESSFLFDLVP